jgi:hypothetical protein
MLLKISLDQYIHDSLVQNLSGNVASLSSGSGFRDLSAQAATFLTIPKPEFMLHFPFGPSRWGRDAANEARKMT